MHLERVAAMLLALACLSGCMSATKLAAGDIRMLPYTTSSDPNAAGDYPTPGLWDSIWGPKKIDRPVKLLTVHGIVVSNPEYSKPWQTEIGKALGLVLDQEEPVTVDLERGYDIELGFGAQPAGRVPAKMKTRVTRSVWRDKAGGTPKLIVYELFWAPIRDDIKYRYLGCFESRSEPAAHREAFVKWTCPSFAAKRNEGSRALVNGILKDDLMVRGFADAVIYNGALGDVLSDDLSLAKCLIAFDTLAYQKAVQSGGSPSAAVASSGAVIKGFETHRCEPAALPQDQADQLEAVHRPISDSDARQINVEYFVITHSLGSYFFLAGELREELLGFSADEDPDAPPPRKGHPARRKDFIQLPMFLDATVVMFANQVSLLSLANLRGYCVIPGEDADSLKPCPNPLMDPATEMPSQTGRLTTYVAFNDADDVLGFELPPFLANSQLGRMINVTVHNPGLEIPWLFRNPADVHTTQASNPAIMDAIIHGITIPKPAP